MRTLDDDNFIDDTGVDPTVRFGSDNEGSAGNAPQVGTLYSTFIELFNMFDGVLNCIGLVNV